MNTQVLRIVIIVISLLCTTSCTARDIDSQTYDLPNALYEEWQLIESHMDETTLLGQDLSGVKFGIHFKQNNKVSGVSACNRWSSTFALSDNKLNAKPAAMTRKRCHHKSKQLLELNSRFPAELLNTANVSIREGLLRLEWENGNYWVFQISEE